MAFDAINEAFRAAAKDPGHLLLQEVLRQREAEHPEWQEERDQKMAEALRERGWTVEPPKG